MVDLKVKTKRLTITTLLLITIIITSGFVAKISAIDKSTVKSMNVVVVRKNELLLVSLNDSDKNISLDSGGIFSRPLISPNKNQVSYIKDNVLYIANKNLEHIKVAENSPQLSFAWELSIAWQDDNSLLYSPTSGGLYVYDVVNKISIPYLKNEFNYQNITIDSMGKIYAEQYLFYKKNGSDYIKDYGILFFDPITKDKKIVVRSIPNKMGTGGDLGMYPIITGISKDDKYLYIWKHPHSGSIAADGVDLTVYDIFNNKLIEYTTPNIISLAYTDNISQNPKISRLLALIYGGGRGMDNSKDLVVLDVLTGKINYLSPKGEVAMTPYYTSDGKTILYASSPEQKQGMLALSDWFANGKHHIFSLDTITKHINQLTNNNSYFDFSSTCIDNNKIIFFRSDKAENVSIWKYENGKEKLLADGLIFYTEMNYPTQSYYGHFNSTAFTDIK